MTYHAVLHADTSVTSLIKEDYGVDTLKITDDDAAFILGKGGKTKDRIRDSRARGFKLYGWADRSCEFVSFLDFGAECRWYMSSILPHA